MANILYICHIKIITKEKRYATRSERARERGGGENSHKMQSEMSVQIKRLTINAATMWAQISPKNARKGCRRALCALAFIEVRFCVGSNYTGKKANNKLAGESISILLFKSVTSLKLEIARKRKIITFHCANNSVNFCKSSSYSRF